ncbi:helix-turn-helix transcriptional regulator [Cupriavidus basilensis]
MRYQMSDRTRIARQHADQLHTHHVAAPAPAEYARTDLPASQGAAIPLRSGPLWRLQRVLEYTSISKSQWYRLMAAGDAPLSVRLSERSRAWYAAEIMAWTTSRSVGGAE